MIHYIFKHFGLFFVIVLHLRETSSSNLTEKNLDNSFVVRANYGVQSENTKPNTNRYQVNSESFSPSTYHQYGHTEHPLTGNVHYQPTGSYLPTTQQQYGGLRESTNVDHLKSYEQNYGRTMGEFPAANDWHSTYVPHSYYSNNLEQIESTTIGSPKNYLQRSLMKEIVPPLEKNTGFNDQDPSNSNFQRQITKPPDVVYGSGGPSSKEIINDQWSKTKNDASGVDEVYSTTNARSRGYQVNENLNEFHKPTITELQNIINKIIKGNSKVHQVVKVPAVYEIHLQDEEEPSHGSLLQHIQNFEVPLPQWSGNKQASAWQQNNQGPGWNSHAQYPSEQALAKPYSSHWKEPVYKPEKWNKKRFHSKARPWNKHQQHSMKMWNLPSKIKYFDDHSNGYNQISPPIYGSRPKPFSVNNRWTNSGTNKMSLQQSVSVPMTPGSTAVTFLDYKANTGHQNHNFSNKNPSQIPDLSLYYAKKKEIENNEVYQESSRIKNSYRRGGTDEVPRYRTDLKRDIGSFFPLSDLNYIIYVREKSNR